ncbi:MAG: hypothetical protein M3Q45_07055 [Chloroflexota bacterium]|nr:hypothetical protein [Chloroflexota bacterium]
MNISAQAFLEAITEAGCFQQIQVHTEGPILKGHGYISEKLFARFYMNQRTQTVAFALIRNEERIWGIDHDHRRKWHQHPLGSPDIHQTVEPLSIIEIIQELLGVLARLQTE